MFTANSVVSFAAFVAGSKHPGVDVGHSHCCVSVSYTNVTRPDGWPKVGHEKHTPFSVGDGNDPVGQVSQRLPPANRTFVSSSSTTTCVAGAAHTQSF